MTASARPIDRPQGANRALGILAKSVEGGRAGMRKPAADPAAKAAGMRGRYELLRTAQSVLFRPGAEPGQQHRTCWCHRSIANRTESIGVYRHREGTGARLSGVGTCGSVWTCPVCSSKIAEARRRELQAAMIAWTEKGGHAYLVTLTTPHRDGDPLRDLFERQRTALRTFRGSARFRRVAKAYERIGAVHASEVTWGANGWHPHAHDLWLASAGLETDRPSIRALRGAWLRAQLKAGLIRTDGTLRPLRDAWKHGLDLRGGQYAAEYIAKFGRDESWGMSSEMTRPHAKVGIRRAAWTNDDHFTPFALLEWARHGDHQARVLFREYADVYTGRRMLTWSRGLKDRMRVEELTDEQLAAAPAPEEEKVGSITADEYAVVLAACAVGELLEYAATCCLDPDTGQRDLHEFIDVCRRKIEYAGRPPGRPVMRRMDGGVRTYPAITEGRTSDA